MFQQLSLLDEIIEDSPTTILNLLREHLDLAIVIPSDFTYKFYKRFGRSRDYSLTSFIYSLLLQKLWSIPTDSLLITILKASEEVRTFCGLSNKVFDKSLLSRFKSTFSTDIENLFHCFVELTEPLCREFDKTNSEILSIDTTGIEPYVKENNHKLYNSLFKKWSSLIKNSDSKTKKTDAFMAAWGEMPKHSTSNPDATLQYINSHFTYALKTAVVCNGMGIIRHMEFCPDTERDNLNPVEKKSISDCRLFKPTIDHFYDKHPCFANNYKYILADSGFDSTHNFNFAFSEKKLIPVIAKNPRFYKSDAFSKLKNHDFTCPRDKNLPLAFDGIIIGKNRNTRFKYMCPKTKRTRNGYVCSCDNPCTSSKCGLIQYDFPKDDIRANAPIKWDTPEWNNLYKKRVVVERDISMLKTSLVLGGSFLRNSKSSKTDFFMAGIAHLAVVFVAFMSKLFNKLLSVKSIA